MKSSIFFPAVLIGSALAGPILEAKDQVSKRAVAILNYVDTLPAGIVAKRDDDGDEKGDVDAHILAARNTLPNTVCPAGQTYDRSVCLNSHKIRSFCIANPRANNERITDTPCNPNEICVQRTLATGKTYASCLPTTDLVNWNTPSAGGNVQGCESIRSSASGYVSLATMLYDANGNPISTAHITFTGVPGNVNEGMGAQASYYASKIFQWATFGATGYINACVISGGAGSLSAVTWQFQQAGP